MLIEMSKRFLGTLITRAPNSRTIANFCEVGLVHISIYVHTWVVRLRVPFQEVVGGVSGGRANAAVEKPEDQIEVAREMFK